MKILGCTFILVSTFIGLTSQAQQLGLNNVYNQNLYLINPSVVGMTGYYNGFINHRKQWTGIDNGPQVSGVTLDGRVFGAHGLGMNLQFSSAGITSQFSGKVSYAYHLRTGKKSYLHSGFSLGINNQELNLADVIATDYTDPTLTEGVQSGWGFSNDLGFMFTTPRLRLGFSIPQTFNTGQELNLGTGEKMNAYAAYDVIANDQWKLESSVLYRNSKEQDDQIDVGAKLMWENTIGLGTLYRTNYGVAGLAQLNINDKLMVVYSYEFGGNDVASSRKGSHGILLGFRISKNKKSQPPSAPTKEVLLAPQEEIAAQEPIQEEIVTKESIQEEKEPLDGEEDKEIITALIIEEHKLDIEALNVQFSHRDHLIRFEHASSNVISNNQEQGINEVTRVLLENPDLKVTIVGHASSIGGTDVNQKISEERAEKVANILINNGVKISRVTHIGHGESEPIEDNSTEYGASENRRVQVIFSLENNR